MSLSHTDSEILSLIYQNLKRSHDPEHIPFGVVVVVVVANSLLCAQIGNEDNAAFKKLIDHFEQIKQEGMLKLIHFCSVFPKYPR